MRVCAPHASPVFISAVGMRPGIVVARSASSRMIAADLPPSSSVQRLSRSPHNAAIRLPATVEPVNEILSTSGWVTMCSPTSRPACTMLSTPAGSPASCTASASRYAFRGASGAGFNTTVDPDASAGASFSMVTNSGTFHGTMAPTTPTGSPPPQRRLAPHERRAEHALATILERELAREPRVVVEHHRGGEDLTHHGERDRRAHLLGDGPRDLLVAPLQDSRERGHDVGALCGRHARPRAGVERLARGGDGAVDVGGGGVGDLGDDLFGRR